VERAILGPMKIMTLSKRRSILLATILVSVPAFAGDLAEWKLSTGFDQSEGDYGEPTDTTIFYLPVSLGYSRGPWSYKVTIPWIEIEGAGNVIGGGEGGVILPGGQGSRGGQGGQNDRVTTESGLGDVWISGTWSVSDIDPNLFFLDLTGKIKLPTADEDKGLGTGELDYTLQAELYKSLGRWTPMATLAYKVKGDPEAATLNNVLYVSAGADYRLNDQRSLGATLDYQEASSSGADNSLELFMYLGQRLSPEWSGSVYTYLGLTDGSPDYGLGLQASYRF